MRTLRPLLFVALLAVFLSGNQAGALMFMDISINLITPPPGKTSHGYVEYQIEVKNHSANRARTIEIVIPDKSYTYSEVQKVRLTAQIPPQTSKSLFFWHPPANIEGSDLSLAVDGYRWPDQIAFKPYDHCSNSHYSGQQAPPTVLVSNSIALTQLSFPEPVKKSGYYEEKQIEPIRSDLPVNSWSSNWLGYTCYDGIILTADDLQRMNPAQRTTMERYVETGGVLLVFGRADLPRSWQRWSYHDFGAFSCYLGGFGACYLTDNATKRGLLEKEAGDLIGVLGNRLQQLVTRQSAENANRAFPVIKGSGVPVRGMLVLMLLYAVIVGPVNLLFLARSEKKLWILWTVPVISLITCGVVFLYAIFGEGFWGAKCRIDAVTFLDENTHRSASLAWLGLYSTLSIGEGLHFSIDTEATPQVSQQYYRSAAVYRSYDWSRDQNLDEGWISSRVPVHFRVRNTQSRRERLTIKMQSDGKLQVVNGLGARIISLDLVDARGNTFHGNNIFPGKEAVLISGASNVSHWVRGNELFMGFTEDWQTFFQRSRNTSIASPLRGRYVAVLDGAPFVETGLAHTYGEISSTVYGVLKEEP